MASFTLTDIAADAWTDAFALDALGTGLAPGHAWSVTKRTLRGGRRDGVDLIVVDNGALSMGIVPTRGMGLWRGRYRGHELGWASPVLDGPVHPAFVHLGDRGGLGWLDGFDELMVRCGLDSNGPPYEGRGLHGRIANIPAHHVSVHVDEAPPHAITVEGRVSESTLFHAQIEMTTRVTTEPGSNRITVRDEFANRSDSPGSMQLLYHWNFGPPTSAKGRSSPRPSRNSPPGTPGRPRGSATGRRTRAPSPASPSRRTSPASGGTPPGAGPSPS